MPIDQHEVDSFLADHRAMHSEFQIANFIVGGAGTAYGQYMQSLREIKTRDDRLRGLAFELENKKLDIEEMIEIGSKNLGGAYIHERRRELKIDLTRRGIEELKTTIAEVEREMSAFLSLARDRLAEIGPLTPERHQELERENWIFKTKRLAALDIVSAGVISHATAELMAFMPPDCRREVIQAINDRPRLLACLEGGE